MNKIENNFDKKNASEENNVYFITVLVAVLGFNVIVWAVSIVANILSLTGLDGEYIISKCIDLLNNKMIAMLLSQIMIFIPTLVFLFNKKKLVRNRLNFNKINVVTFFLLIIFTYALVPVMSFLNLLSMMFVENQVSGTINEILDKYPIFIGIIIVAVLPALVEEILFRGIIYNAHRQYNIKIALVVNGLLFGLLHGNFNQFAYAFFMGIVFALVVEVTNSVISTIWCHFIINANSLIITLVTKEMGVGDIVTKKVTYTWKDVFYQGCFAMVALAFAILILIFIAKYNKRYDYIIKILCKNSNELGKSKNNEEIIDEKMNQDDKIKNSKIRGIFTFSLIFAIFINIIYMISIEIWG